MLDGNVQILDDLRLGREDINELVGHLIRVEIVHAHPDDAVNFAQLRQQRRQTALAVEVQPVAAGVLRDDDQLFHAGRGKLARFF